MTSPSAQNSLYERYASREMVRIFSSENRYQTWRRMWISLAECQQKLGLPISTAQIAALERVAPGIDFARVAEIERETRHDVVAHLRHFAEQSGDAGSILHLGATSAFVTDNTDVILFQEALALVEKKTATVMSRLSRFAEETRSVPTLARTHLQPAQLTTIGKRTCIWLQDFLSDLEEIQRLQSSLRCRGVKGTTGTQASYLTLFDGDHDKVKALDRNFAQKIGFKETYPLSGQTYSRKQDSRVLAVLAGVGESSHKFGTDLRLLQGLGELSEPFGSKQVGSSAMAYKRNPIRSERICALSRRLIIDALNGPLTTATQWLERSLDDSANRRLVLPEAFLLADAILDLAANIAAGIYVNEERVRYNVASELPFMATEDLLMKATVGGGNRQQLHEIIREHSMTAHAAVAAGEENPLIRLLADDSRFGLAKNEIEAVLDSSQYVGRAPEQVQEFLVNVVLPALEGAELVAVEEPRV